MKKLLLLLSSFAMIIAAIYSCQNEEKSSKAELLEKNITSLKSKQALVVDDFSKLAGTWILKCSGQCGCVDNFNLNTGIHSCSCSPCAMDIEYIPKKGNINYSTGEKQEVMDYLLKDYDFMTEFKNYIKTKNANLESIAIVSMTHTFDEEYRFSLVIYKNESGVEESVSFYQNKRLPTKYTVDCHGSCGCVEQFNPATAQVSCSCSPCEMTITDNK